MVAVKRSSLKSQPKVEEIFPYLYASWLFSLSGYFVPTLGLAVSQWLVCRGISHVTHVPSLCFPIWISLLFSFSLMQCQLGVLPLGTGNDLARVLGWGSACDDDTQLPQILEKLERASTKMLDRWVTITNIALHKLCENILSGERGSPDSAKLLDFNAR